MQTDKYRNQVTTALRIDAHIFHKLNFAAHQSAFPLLRRLQVENHHPDHPVEDLILTLQSNPEFIRQKTWHLDRIANQERLDLKDRDLEVNGEFLLKLTDSVRGTILFRLERDGEVLSELIKPVELLAYNEWGGAGFMPELLAAFSMPNDPTVDTVLASAGKILRRAGKQDSIDGYQSQSRQHVWEIASAIYSAIANLGLIYAAPPASFESDGQKIRLPGQILEGRVATCLDTAMLFASAFEQAGLNPVVALPKDHALAGVWLQPEDLSAIVIDEAETLRKRVDLQELVLVETTYVTSHPALPFSKALEAAISSIRVDDDSTFIAAIDIHRARAHRIAPLGLNLGGPAASSQSSDPGAELPLEESPGLPNFDNDDLGGEERDTAESRLERWQRKLLDLTLRNPLLNHRATKTSLRIICPDPGLLEDKLAEGSRIQIKHVPQPSSEGQDQELHRQREGEQITEEYARDELDRRRVLVDLPQDQLSQRAVEIYRKAETALEEGGANTLFLAVGFLLWKRDQNDDRKYRAPLILLPVTLERKSVRSGVRMLAHEDEPRFNTTLLEMLRRDFRIEITGLDGELPEDDSGLDVAGIWNKIRREVKEAPGFEVVEDVVLGHFSFAKYLMWKDLVDRTDALRGNAVVRHLLDTPHDPYDTGGNFVVPGQLDRDYKPSDLLTPLPADSSQMSAIATADKGKDFVMIGPPGTGKSQTISNLIAHLLGMEKTVLFVSEKTAALNVVFDRLKKIGLGRFCLELHSNKARKADVLKQLRTSWEMAGLRSCDEWQQRAEELRILRDKLNQLVDRLHTRRRNGLTAHYAIGVRVRDEDLAKRVTLSWPCGDYHDEATRKMIRKAVEKLAIQAQAVGDLLGSPFQLVETSDWTPQWESQVATRSGVLSAVAVETERVCDSFCKATGIEFSDYSMVRLDGLGELASLLIDSYRQPTAFALGPEGLDRIEALQEAAGQLKEYAEAKESLSCAYEPFAWRVLDGEVLGRRWAEATKMWWLRRFFAKRGILKEMRANGAQGLPDPENDAPILESLRQKGEAIDRLDQKLSGFKGWSGHGTDPSVVDSLRKLGERARTTAGKLADDPRALVEIRSRIRSLLDDGNDLLATSGSVGHIATTILDALERLRQASSDFEDVVGTSMREGFGTSDNALRQMRHAADAIKARHNELRDWCAWRKRRAEALEAELSPLVEAVEHGQVPPAEIEDTFEASYCAWWSRALFEEDDVLRTFSTPEHEDTINKFQNTDDSFQKLTAEYISATLAGSLPDQDSTNRNSKWGVLRRELQKQRRHKPVRKLLEEAPEVLRCLTPCFMMSPLSVAQYLPADHALFDVVIFDEASQITVWDAVGSIARGGQVIVAGDPKQMPPTNFFSRSDDDPDGDIDTEGDLESILDEMLGSSIPSLELNLHYRSRSESLIAFSNDRYYDNHLITFPAPDVADRTVSLRRPEGFYARGGARQNEGEARAIVNEIVQRLRNENDSVRNNTIGVVTFNSEQQTLIEDLLDNARSKYPEIEEAFSHEQVTEPVFVKNLETVQGDERDIILFSVTYGPDRTGHVTMNFGPLNREGGERRLNVAVTRARKEMIVFSTLHPDRIDLARTQAPAVADLKDFLDYAEHGQSVLGSSVLGYSMDFESPFEETVARELRGKNWQVRPQVGVSAYRIDLGIVHPDLPGRYLAGIECDGAMYHSSAFARERDKIRQSVLEDLGWTIFRIWSMDWWTNKEGALQKVDDFLTELLEESRQLTEQESPIREAKSKDVGSVEGNQVRSLEGVGDHPVDEDSEVYVATRESDTLPTQSRHAPYSVFEGRAGPDPRNTSTAQVVEVLCRIIQDEGPMLAKRAYDVYLRGCGIRRMGGELKRLMNKALQLAIWQSLVLKEDEWSTGGLPNSIVRLADVPPIIVRERGPRSFEEIPPSELQLVARMLLTEHKGQFESGSKTHLKAVLASFGLHRLTAPVEVKLRDILERPYSYVDEALSGDEGKG